MQNPVLHYDPNQVADVLFLDADKAVTATATRALFSAGHGPLVVEDVAQALDIIHDGGPRIVVVDWDLLGEKAAEFCRAARKRKFTYVIALADRHHPRQAIESLAAGADEHMAKPFSPEYLAARITWAKKILAAFPAPSQKLRLVLAEAARTPGGELVLKQGDTVGRVYLQEGEVIWAHCSDCPTSLESILEGRVSREDVRSVIDEARESGTNFVEVLVKRGLATEEQAVAAVRRTISQAVRAMFMMADPHVVFVPLVRERRWTGPRFPLSAMLPPETRRALPLVKVTVPPPPQEHARCQLSEDCTACERVGASLEDVLKAASADGIAIVHAPSGDILGRAGQPIDSDLLHAQVKVLSALRGVEDADDVVVSGRSRYYLLRQTGCRDAVVCLMGSKDQNSLGAFKHEIGALSSRIVEDAAASARRLRVKP